MLAEKFMAAILRQDLLHTCTLLKARLGQEVIGDTSLVQDLRQKLNEPPPFFSDPSLHEKLHKTHAAYRKTVSDLIAIYQQITGLVEQQIAFIDHVIDQMQTSEIIIDISESLKIFRSHLDPLQAHGVQLRRNLQADRARICIMTNEAEMNVPIEMVQNNHESKEIPIYPCGLRRRVSHQLGTSLGSSS